MTEQLAAPAAAPAKKVPWLVRLGLKRPPEDVAAQKAAADQAAAETSSDVDAEVTGSGTPDAPTAAVPVVAPQGSVDTIPAGPSSAAASAGTAASGSAPAGASSAPSPTALTKPGATPPTSPWARPTAATTAGVAGASAGLAAADKGESSTAADAGSTPESRFPQPASPEVTPGEQTGDASKPEDVAGPSTAVLPAVAGAGAVTGVAGVGGNVKPVEPHPPALKPKAGTARRTRKARLRLSRLDPWSVMKTSFLFSIAAGIMLVVAVYVVWTVLATSGLFDSVNEIVASVVSTPGDTTPFRIEEYINTQKVMGISALIACVDVVIFTALATLGSFLYNLAATMLGGLEITLAED